MEKIIPALLVIVILSGCSTPTVNLGTSEPIKVDINMRLDVFQHSPPADKKPASKPAAGPAGTVGAADAQTRRRNRLADIQQFKNSRIIGEAHTALVVIRVDTPGDYGDYVRKVVAEENEDRMALMKAASEKEKISLPEVQNRQSAIWQKMAFKDEWIEVPAPDGTWKWVQKEG